MCMDQCICTCIHTFSMCSFGVGQRRIYLGWLIPVEGYTPRSGALTARSVLYINWYVSLTACSGLYIWLWGFLISKTRAVRAATKHLSVSLHCRLWRSHLDSNFHVLPRPIPFNYSCKQRTANWKSTFFIYSSIFFIYSVFRVLVMYPSGSVFFRPSISGFGFMH